MRQNWCTPVKAPITAQSPTITCPPSVDAVRQHRVIADLHIVRHVDVGHQQIVVADARDQAAAFGAAMDGDEFANACCGCRCAFRRARPYISDPARRRRRWCTDRKMLSSPIQVGPST